VERQDGTGWSIEHAPPPNGSSVLLQTISCTSNVTCTAIGNTGREGVIAEQSAPARSRLTGIPTGCTKTQFTAHVTSVHRGARYAALIPVSPGRHKLIVTAKFTVSSQTAPVTFHRDVLGCSPAH
jgi:hypothetical protein